MCIFMTFCFTAISDLAFTRANDPSKKHLSRKEILAETHVENALNRMTIIEASKVKISLQITSHKKRKL